MQSMTFEQLFIDKLEDMYDSEQQIVESLPKLIKLASCKELKEALSTHLEETENQITRIEKIFSILDLPANKKPCEAMEGILKEGEELVQGGSKGAILDAAIISAAQKVEHYEMASYGTLRSFAKYLELDGDIVDLIQESLDEEGAADKTLTKIAEGGFFSSGINKEAVSSASDKKRR